jgi:hypothetical protein
LSLFIRYYEDIKNLQKAREHPLFWLQYAIVCLAYKEFTRAESYFKTAYSYGEAKNFDLFQIDNHYARYLLTRSVNEENWKDPLEVFYEAHNIVNRQMLNERLSYPYRVARFYASFYRKYRKTMEVDERNEIVNIARNIYHKIMGFPREKQSQRNYRECAKAMRAIINLGP